MIADHVFRDASHVGGHIKDIRPGCCCYLGSCNRPPAEHERSKPSQPWRARKRRTAGAA